MNDLMTLSKPSSLVPVDPAAVAAAEAAKARIQSAYLMAMHRPRNVDQARINILEACRRPMFAERAEYSKPVGERAIKGPSIRFAELAMREWGNILTETQTVYEDASIRRIKVIVTDLESNATHSKDIQISKTVERQKTKGREVVGERINSNGEKVYIVKATDDELYNKESALISKAVRNEGLRLIPSDIVDEGIEVAKKTLHQRDAADPAAAKKKLLDSFAGIGIKPADLEKYLRHTTNQITPAELQDLRGVYRALKDGESTWADYVQPTPTEEKTESKKDELKQKLRGRPPKQPDQPLVTNTPPVGSPVETEMPQDLGADLEDVPKVECPRGDLVYATWCDNQCPDRQGCPSWPEEDSK